MNTVNLGRIFMFLLFVCPSPYVFVALGGSASPAMLLGLAMFGWWALTRATNSLSAAHSKQPIRIASYIFIASILASMAAAYARVLPAAENQATIRGFVIALSFIGVILFFSDGLKDRNDVEKVVKAFVIGGSFVAVIGILQFITKNEIAPYLKLPGLGAVNDFTFVSERNGLPRVAGTAYHPIEYAVVLCAIWPFALRNAVMNWTKTGKLIALLPFILITCALPTALSRTAVVAFGAIVFTIWFTWTSKRKSRFILASALGIVCLFIFAPKLPTVLIELFTKADQDVSITTRTSDYAQAGKEIRNHLFFGRGYKTYDPNTYIYLDNQFLLSLIETGLFGLLAIVGIFSTGIVLGRNIKHKAKDRFISELGQCCASSLFAILLCFVTFDTLSFPMISFVSASIIGISGALWRINKYANGHEEMAFHLTTSRVIESQTTVLAK